MAEVRAAVLAGQVRWFLMDHRLLAVHAGRLRAVGALGRRARARRDAARRASAGEGNAAGGDAYFGPGARTCPRKNDQTAFAAEIGAVGAVSAGLAPGHACPPP